MTAEDQAYSALEVVSQRPRYEADPGKQVSVDDDKQFTGDNVGLELALKEDPDTHKVHVHPVLSHRLSAKRLSARRRIILCGLVGLILILGAVLGGVLGSRHKNSATSSSVLPVQRNIAAVSFTSNSANITQVYFQDNVGQIIEASNSGENNTWSINRTGISGKNGSVIAAAVSRPSLPLVGLILLVYRVLGRHKIRKSAYSISMCITLSTTSFTRVRRVSGPRGRYRLKDTPQWQTPAYQPCTTGANFAPIPPSLLSKMRTALSRLAILHPMAGL